MVVARDDSLHLLLLGVAVEGGVSAQEEVRDHAHCPDIDGLAVARWKPSQDQHGKRERGRRGDAHFLKISGAMYPGVPVWTLRPRP